MAMYTEDEANSYLKYLNDSETPNAYLLENNEVGLFSVEPIFTEMAASDWPHDGFPLLLTNSLIAEGSLEECQSNNNLVHPPSDAEDLPENIALQNIDHCLEPTDDDLTTIHLTEEGSEISLEHIGNAVSVQEVPFIQLHSSNEDMMETCLQFDGNELEKDDLEAFKREEPDRVVKSLSDESVLVTNKRKHADVAKRIELLNSDGTPIPIDDSVLASLKLRGAQKRSPPIQEKPKLQPISDLFSTVIANKCKVCSFLCEDLQQINEHISTKHLEYIFSKEAPSNMSALAINPKPVENREFTIYVCSECRAVCTTKNDLKNHMIGMHGLVTQPLPDSNGYQETLAEPVKKVSAYSDDVNHILVRKQEKMLQRVKCTVKGCIAAFPSEELRRRHESLHIGNTKSMFKCSDCDKQFMSWVILRGHMHKEHGIDFGMIVCPMCSMFKTYRTVMMFKHMMIHSDVKPFLCSDCGKSFRQLSQLKNHEASHKMPDDMPTWSRVKKCDKCNQFFANSKSLKCHIKTVHEKIKPFICNICGHKSSRKAMLELHMRQHTASKPFKCDYCNYRTGDHNCLRKHVMKHVGAVGYQCPYCTYTCIQAGSLKGHFRAKHKNKPGVYFCKYCAYNTINDSSLNAHEISHHLSSKGTLNSDSNLEARDSLINTDLQTDEETQSCFLNTESQLEEAIDNGGITIPADLELP
ncbi:hypothetical protein HUJ04_008837 [Dendroctonus ponderosae]|uniref:C2H2-type domain-containing protein n=2 Tax=Dendroctonus ponderosae TaxID=77166 RepID=A0AAR5PNK8_DENPD|nr:hypothetical protein HUJ04_008837 [Dendroctonus ponderosae]